MFTPQTLGSYQVERELGRGGMGVVFLARDPRLNRQVAIKIVPDALAQNPDNLARFEREAKLLAAVNHPNIASIYEIEETGAGHGFMLVMEYVPGDTLADRLRLGPLPMSEALDVARQIASAVEAAHEAGIVHRDLKPGNVKVTPDGRVKVLDFGLAKGASASSADLAQSPTLTYSPTAIGIILGTAGYMSPEQARGKPVDRRADIWAFGCVLYECLTGRKTFDPSTGSGSGAVRGDADSVQDIIAAVLRQEPDWDALPAATPPAIRALLRRCLEKDVRKRQRDIGDVRLEIENALATPSPPSERASAVLAPAAGPTARWLVPSIAAIAGIGVGALLWSQFVSPRDASASNPLHLSIAIPSTLRVNSARFVHDGRDVIFAAYPRRPDGSEDPQRRLFVRSLSSFDFREIPGTEGTVDWSRSPDGKSVAVVKSTTDQTVDLRLVRVPIDGSSPPLTISEWSKDWTGLKWLADGDLLIQTAQGSKFFRMPSTGGSPKPQVTFDFGGPKGFPSFSWELPDRRGVIVRLETFGAQGYQQDVYVLNPDTGRATRIVENAGGAYYEPGVRHLFYAQRNTIYAVPFDIVTLKPGGAPVSLLSGLRAGTWGHGSFEIASDGSLLFQAGGRLGADRRIVILEPNRPPMPFIPERRSFEADLALSADGRHMATVIGNARGTFEIWTATAGQPGLRKTIAVPTADCAEPLWSPDGKWIAFFRSGRHKDDGVYLAQPYGTGALLPVLMSPDFNEPAFASGWLPDSSGLLLFRIVGTRIEPLLVRISKDGVASPPELLRDSTNSAGRVVVSPDGKTVLFVADDSGRPEIYVADWSKNRISGLVPIGSVGEPQEIYWAADSKRYFYRIDRTRIMTASIERSPSLRSTTPVIAADLAALRLDTDAWHITPDGHIAAVQLGTGEGDQGSYSLVLNWMESVRQRLRK